MCSSYKEGVLNIINIVDMQKSFVLAWVTTLKQPGYEKCKTLPRYFFSHLGKHTHCFEPNASANTFLCLERIKSYFGKQMFMSCLECKSILKPNKEKDKAYIDIC